MPVNGKGVCAAAGFRASGVAAGIKKSGALDLALIVSDSPAAVAGTFTTNRAAAPPVRVNRERVNGGLVRGVVVNSGCANSFTGARGYDDAVQIAGAAAAAVGAEPAQMLVCSTGHIGSFLPIDAVRKGIVKAAAELSGRDEDAARAIMTTDTRPKVAAVRHDSGWRLGGMAKGAGMIAPNMATMLAFITTDAAVGARELQEAVSQAVESSFNRIVVDGDMSTNDTVLCFANGASNIEPTVGELLAGLAEVCGSLAEQIVSDGEGATKLVRVLIRGAASEEEARRAARAVAESLLVKTAMYGGDPNWGRVAAALGRAGVRGDFDRISISIAGVDLLSAGVVGGGDAVERARAALRSSTDVQIECDLSAGSASTHMLTCDLGPEYVRFNAEYET